MKWALAGVALVVATNGVVVASAARQRRAPAARTTVAVCAGQVMGGGDSEDPPALHLRTVEDSGRAPAGLDSAGLAALGFSPRAIAAVGRPGDSTWRTPRARPAWVRLRQPGDSLGRFAVVAVAPPGTRPAPDSTSLVLRGRVTLVRRAPPPPEPDAAGAHRHGAPVPGAWGALYPTVVEVVPSALHLDRRQGARLRRALGGSTACRAGATVVVGTGARGGIWVEEAP